MTELVERLLPTPEIHGLNLFIGKIYLLNIFYCQLYWKDGNIEKVAVNGTFKKSQLMSSHIGVQFGSMKLWKKKTYTTVELGNKIEMVMITNFRLGCYIEPVMHLKNWFIYVQST